MRDLSARVAAGLHQGIVMTDYKVSKKIDDKWQTFGSVKKNQWDKMGLGLRCTIQFKKMIADIPDGDWINFDLFEEKDNYKK